MKKSLLIFISLACVIIMLTPMLVACDADGAAKKTESSLNVIVPDAPKAVAAGDPVKTTCAPCHQNMVASIDNDSHAVHDCAQCHTPGDHPTNPTVIKPVTNLTPELCGGCHTDQYCSFMTINLNSSARVEKATPEGVSPAMDKLLAGHGFTVEHNEPRSHAFMLIDQTVVDRAYGGRYMEHHRG